MIRALILIVSAVLSVSSITIPPETVKELDALQYMGKWYEVYSSFYPRTTFERNGYCITATYGPLTTIAGKVSFAVLNSENIGGPRGAKKQVKGYATNNLHGKTADTGKFYVFFDNVPTIGHYWVVALGPVVAKPDGSNQYDWAVVSTPFETQLFILARDVAFFKANYEAAVLSQVKSLGFDKFFNKPIETYQGSDCKYTWTDVQEAEEGEEVNLTSDILTMSILYDEDKEDEENLTAVTMD